MKEAKVDIELTLDNGVEVKLQIKFYTLGYEIISVENLDPGLGGGLSDLLHHFVRLLNDPQYNHLFYNSKKKVKISVERNVGSSTLADK